MSNGEVKIKVGVDGSGVETGLRKAQGLISAFASKVGSQFGGAAGGTLGAFGSLVAGAGVASIFGAAAAATGLLVELSKKTAEFAHSMQELSDRMDISTDKVQDLAFASELMGKDVGYAENLLIRSNEFAEKALSFNAKDIKERMLAQKLNFTDEELRTLGPAKMMEEIVKRSKANHLSETDLDTIFGRRQGRKAVEFAEKEQSVSEDTLKMTPEMIATLSDEWEKLKTILHNLWMETEYYIGGLLLLERVLRIVLVDAIDAVMKKILELVAWITRHIPGMKGFSEQAESISNSIITRNIIQDVINNAMVNPKNSTPFNREAASESKIPHIASNEFVKIGGLLGVDTDYRLKEMANDIARMQLAALNSIDSKTGINNTKDNPIYGYDNPFSSVPTPTPLPTPLNITPGRRAGT